jgi:hypothetical protein
MLYGEFEELGGVEMIAARLNARNDDVPSSIDTCRRNAENLRALQWYIGLYVLYNAR